MRWNGATNGAQGHDTQCTSEWNLEHEEPSTGSRLILRFRQVYSQLAFLGTTLDQYREKSFHLLQFDDLNAHNTHIDLGNPV